MPRILLTSVFKPFGRNDIYGRVECIPEILHNQLTRYQGVYSPRQQYPSVGLHAIAQNIGAPSTVLDWPTLDRYIREIRKDYDYIGISSIIPNFQRVKKMVELTRKIKPGAKIILGGFCSTIENLENLLDVDYIASGEGISFMRSLLGEPPEFTFVNPDIVSVTRYIMGAPIHLDRAIIVTGLGCSYNCDFCSPSSFFGNKSINLLPTGEAVWREMHRLSRKFRTNEFIFMGDDNFFTEEKRLLELHYLIKKNQDVFNIATFGSADLTERFGAEFLAELGVDWLWLGRESKFSKYQKNREIDFHTLIPELKRWGVNTVLSSILLLDEHDKWNIYEDISDHISCGPTYSQFAHLSPVPGTKLWDRLRAEARILMEIPFEEWHAFKQPWFSHSNFTLEEAEEIQRWAYLADFYRLGPGSVRRLESCLEAFDTFTASSNPLLHRRARMLAKDMPKNRVFLLAAGSLAPTAGMRRHIEEVLHMVEERFGRVTVKERAMAAALTLTARVWEGRVALMGDVIQPQTEVTYYNQ